MGYAQPRRRAVALSRFDIPDDYELMVSSCEDCACVVSDSRAGRRRAVPPVPAGPDDRSWVRGGDVAEFPFGGEYRMLFNPLGSGGVVVVNELAHDIFRAFETPATVADVRRSRPSRGVEVTEIFRRLGQLQLIHPSGEEPRPEFQAGRVLTAWLHVTNGCNLRCPYCYLEKSPQPMDEATGRAAVAAVMRSAVANGFPEVKLKYAGGEASLNHRLVVTLHSYARELAAEFGLLLQATLLSNGVRLPDSLVQACKAEGIRVMVSLDGVGDQHDVQRPFPSGKPSFRFVERTIGELIAQGHPPHLSVTITSRNISGIPDVVRFALERDLTFSLNLFRDNDCASGFTDLRYQEQAMISTLLETFGVIEDFLPRWSVLGSILDRGQLLQPRQRSCGVGQDYVVIDQHGRVAKCHMEIERTIGDVFADDPLQLVRRDTTTALNLLVDEKEGCRDCTWRYWCSGGCSVATFRATGRYDVKSPNCNIYKAIYPAALRLEGLRLLKYAAGS
jgi:uncharacterized protein